MCVFTVLGQAGCVAILLCAQLVLIDVPVSPCWQVIKQLRQKNKHMIIDADGLYITTHDLDLVKGYKRAILTPNKNEFARLAKELKVDLEDKSRWEGVPAGCCGQKSSPAMVRRSAA